MPQKVVKFTGINRAVNEFQASGACEELINLRPDVGGGFKIAKKKEIFLEDVQFDDFLVHEFGDTSNHIYTQNGVVYWLNGDESVALTEEFIGKTVAVSFAGNVIYIYCEDDKKSAVLKFNDDKYEEYKLNLIDIQKAYVHLSADGVGGYAVSYVETDDLSDSGLRNALSSAVTEFYRDNNNGLCGIAIVGCTYELEDGSEIWSTAFTVADARVEPFYLTQEDTGKIGVSAVQVMGCGKATFYLSFARPKDCSVKKINVYATRPISGIDVTHKGGSLESLSKLNLDGQLMYYQGSITGNERSLVLDFSYNQGGSDIMDVDAGCVERVGEMVSYNNRFHCFKSSLRHVIQVPTISKTIVPEETDIHWIPYVKFKEGWKLINYITEIPTDKPNHFIYPYSDVKKLAFVKASMPFGIESMKVLYDEMFYVDLENSSAYNYSFAFDVVPDIVPVGEFYNEIVKDNQVWSKSFVYDRDVHMENETNEINVSAAFNPFVFPVEYSYSFGGEIRDVVTSYLPISATQVGQYPLTVFTGNGIYALEQGNGSTLYSNITPISPLVAEGHAIPVPQGAFFISSNNLYLLAGRDTACVSTVLNGKLDLDIRDNSLYEKIVCNPKGSIHSFEDQISSVEFDEYINGAEMLYDALRNELYISNPSISSNYSYVLNIDTKSFYKSTAKYAERRLGSKYAIEYSYGTRNVVDMLTEIKSGEESFQNILLQSRPFQLEAFYTHIQRLIALVDAKLKDDEQFMLSVFGSDNLKDWKCIINSQKEFTDIRQIRTNKAPKSYKDYVIVINGSVGVDTDLSDIIMDYTVVNRRLG